MIYRELGTTGLRISIIGFGGMRFFQKDEVQAMATVRRCIERRYVAPALLPRLESVTRCTGRVPVLQRHRTLRVVPGTEHAESGPCPIRSD